MCLSLKNGCQCCLPNWQASHTPSISFSLKVGSPMTTTLDCIVLTLLRLIWLIFLCHNYMSTSALVPFANMDDFILCDESALFFNEATALVESNLHALFHNLVDWDQFFSYVRNIQDILDVGFVVFFLEWDIATLSNQMCCVIPSVHIAGSIGRTLNSQNHSSWEVMWFEAMESTNHSSSRLEVLVELEADIEFTLCLLTNNPP